MLQRGTREVTQGRGMEKEGRQNGKARMLGSEVLRGGTSGSKVRRGVGSGGRVPFYWTP